MSLVTPESPGLPKPEDPVPQPPRPEIPPRDPSTPGAPTPNPDLPPGPGDPDMPPVRLGWGTLPDQLGKQLTTTLYVCAAYSQSSSDPRAITNPSTPLSPVWPQPTQGHSCQSSRPGLRRVLPYPADPAFRKSICALCGEVAGIGLPPSLQSTPASLRQTVGRRGAPAPHLLPDRVRK